MKDLADSFKALGDETRLSMLALLIKKQELCVCDFEGTLKISQSKASRHLQTLKHAGYLTDRREGLWVHYRIAPDLEKDQKGILKLLKTMLSGSRVLMLYEDLEKWFEQKNDAENDSCKACATNQKKKVS